MATDVVMPQMGESIAEGTIVRWIKNVGDTVERDEPLFEISTDKVDAEIPSPVAGVVTEIRAKEGDVFFSPGVLEPAGASPVTNVRNSRLTAVVLTDGFFFRSFRHSEKTSSQVRSRVRSLSGNSPRIS